MNGIDTTIEMNRKLITLVDQLLAAGNWEASLFLQVTAKRFRKLRDEAEELLLETSGSKAHSLSAENSNRDGWLKIFVAVYQTEGTQLSKWYHTLKSLPEFSNTRPIYLQEEHVHALLRTKERTEREGYVAAWIKPENILPTGNTTDRLGNELVCLKAKAIQLENIIEFHHCQKVYVIGEEGLLPKQNKQ